MSPQNSIFVGILAAASGKVGDRFWACLAAAALLQSASGSHSGGSDAGILLRSIPAKETLPTRGDGEATPCGKGVMVVAVAVMLRPPPGGLTAKDAFSTPFLF
jgi:hypothetical protein